MTSISKYPRTAAWLIFATGFALILVVDYSLRVHNGRMHAFGVPADVSNGLIFILGLASLYQIWKATANRSSIYFRVAELSIAAILGVVLYLVAMFYYVVGSGIDSL